MILRLADGLWVGDSAAEERGPLEFFGISAVLNVAKDMPCTRLWPNFESVHVGLVDGPGNEPALYCAAVFALHALLRGRSTLVCCHSGSRALAVGTMYLAAARDQDWDSVVQSIAELVDSELPPVHPAHKIASARVVNLLRGAV